MTDTPQNTSVTVDNVELMEGDSVSESLRCVADGSPGPSYYWTRDSYYWTRDTRDNEVVSEGDTLMLSDPVTRYHITCTDGEIQKAAL